MRRGLIAVALGAAFLGGTLTITALDGTRVQGTMTGNFDMPPTAGDPPVALENGRFNVLLTFGA